MRVLPNVVALKWGLIALFLLIQLDAALAAQTSLNDIHVPPREPTPAPGGATGSIHLIGGSLLHVIKTETNLVLVPVSVTDPRERLVTGLSQANFQLFEGKAQQQIQHFSSEDAPASVGIILDVSGSMSNKIDYVRQALNEFCEAANPQDEFFMVTFSDEPQLISDFTSTPEDLEKELLFTSPRGRTALLDAIYLGLNKMKAAKYGKKALLIVSDGGDNHSRYTEGAIKSAAKESDVMIYAIGTFDRYAPTVEEAQGPELLSQISETTGGRTFFLQNAAELPALAHRIGTELRTQYVLAYRPQGSPHDGKWHRIKVKLRLPKKLAFLQPHFRSGYYASQE